MEGKAGGKHAFLPKSVKYANKCAKMLGLGYPGGPLLEQAAVKGNPRAFDLPRPMLGRAGCDFSFSGMKTAVRMALAEHDLTPALVADMAASLQQAIADALARIYTIEQHLALPDAMPEKFPEPQMGDEK